MRDPSPQNKPSGAPRASAGQLDRNPTCTAALIQRIGALERAARARDAEIQGVRAMVGAQSRDIAALRRERRAYPEQQRVGEIPVDLGKLASELEQLASTFSFDPAKPGDDHTAVALVDATGRLTEIRRVEAEQSPSLGGWHGRLRRFGKWLFRSKSCGD